MNPDMKQIAESSQAKQALDSLKSNLQELLEECQNQSDTKNEK